MLPLFLTSQTIDCQQTSLSGDIVFLPIALAMAQPLQTLSSRNSLSQELITCLKFSFSTRFTAT